MPVLLGPDRWAGWLGEKPATDAGLKAMLKPYPGAAMACWPVDRRVGNVRNNSPDLFAPLIPVRSPAD
jgi:putative SOS response-associated peptidase YedK